MSLLKRLPILLSILLGLLHQHAAAQCEFHDESSALLRVLHKHHYAPLSDNADNQSRVIRQYLALADPLSILYSEADLQNIMPKAIHLLDSNDVGICQLIPYLAELHATKLNQFQKELELLNQGTNTVLKSTTYTLNQSILKPLLHENDTDRAEHFHKLIKLMTLMEAQEIALADTTGNNKDADYTQIIATYEKRIQDNIRLALQCRINPEIVFVVTSQKLETIKHLLFDAIVSAQDSHSNFFSFEGITDFLSDIQSDQVNYGLSIRENEKNEKIISDLRPGSSAWRRNDIHVNDKIIKVFLDKRDIGSFDCMSAQELESLINNGAHGSIQLELKSQSGKIKKITLYPEVIILEENALTSLVLKNDSTSIGYIALPSFFSSSDWKIDKGCANAVGTEIIKLKKDNIQGLILDLRFNGGGDVSEAIELAGLFIDVGPIGLQKGQSAKPVILKELNKGILYDGPLAIMVNNFSASASELITYALKDYNRAIVVGHTTYGKASVQNIFQISTAKESLQLDPMPIGFAKITTSILYGITNKSYQAKGISPDFELPNPLVNIGYSEGNEAFALEADTITKKLIFTAYPPLPIGEMQKLSKIRLKQSPYFNALMDHQKEWPQSDFQISLDPTQFASSIARLDEFSNINDELEKQITCPFEIRLPSSHRELTKWDDHFSALYEKNKINASKDAELQECFHIVADLIQLTIK